MNIVKMANFAFSFYFLNVALKNMYPETYNNCLMKISYCGVIETSSKKWLLENYKKFEPDETNINKMTIYTNGIHKKIFNFVPFEESQYNYEKTNYNFILIEILIYSEIKKIDLTTDDYNYMIVGNVINKDFVMYLLKTHYPKFV